MGPRSLSLSASDVEGVLRAARQADEAQPGEEDVRDLLGSVSTLVGADTAYWNRSAIRPRRLIVEIGHPCDWRGGADATYEEWAERIDEHPVMSGRLGPVVSISDVYSMREFRRSWLYRHFFAPELLLHEIGLHLSRPPGQLHLVYLSRGPGPDFSPRDRMVLQLLRPHLDAAFRRLAFPAPTLTPRETAVLRCVRDGDSNSQVARRLGITEATVEKHLEHVYRRTGAQSRVQALNLCAAALD